MTVAHQQTTSCEDLALQLSPALLDAHHIVVAAGAGAPARFDAGNRAHMRNLFAIDSDEHLYSLPQAPAPSAPQSDGRLPPPCRASPAGRPPPPLALCCRPRRLHGLDVHRAHLLVPASGFAPGCVGFFVPSLCLRPSLPLETRGWRAPGECRAVTPRNLRALTERPPRRFFSVSRQALRPELAWGSSPEGGRS